MWFSAIKYLAGVKIYGLTKTFGEIFIFCFKDLKIFRFIEENLFFRMVATLGICLKRPFRLK